VSPGAAGRHIGLGEPLTGTSWLNRPFYAGWLVGALFGDGLSAEVDQQTSLVGGYRFGWDWDYRWGVEGRWAFAHVDTLEPQQPTFHGQSRDSFYDVNLVYYPWGDARWRPFVSVGLGAATFDFRQSDGTATGATLATVPLSTGLKYYWKNWLTLRMSLTDNLALGSEGLDTMHNVSLTGGVEVRWGGARPSYFPYHGSLHVW